jgi:hypothetical protein
MNYTVNCECVSLLEGHVRGRARDGWVGAPGPEAADYHQTAMDRWSSYILWKLKLGVAGVWEISKRQRGSLNRPAGMDTTKMNASRADLFHVDRPFREFFV